MAQDEINDVFPGAQRAASYVESEYTVSGPVLQAVREQARAAAEEADLGEEEWEPQPAVQHVAELPPVPAASAVNVAQPTQLPNTVFLDPVADLSAASTVREQPRATRGLRGMLSKMGLNVEPGAAEKTELAAAEALHGDEQKIRQATWTRAVSILVANKKGGTGKTPSSLVLGGVLAAVRGGSVCILEVSDDPGTLTFRSEGNPVRGIGELVRDAPAIGSAGQLNGYTAPQTSFAAVIGTVGRRQQLNREDITAAARVIDEYYSIRVMDSGNQPSSSAFQGAVETADALVIPMLNAGDSVLDAVATLDELRAQGGHASTLAANAILIRLTDGRPEHPQVLERAQRIIEGMGVRAVYEVPYDAHIAERGQITLDRLAPATRAAYTAAAAGVVDALKTTVG
ncbi:hypothetical protein HII28_19550 [Planctomonas sp. JC2975]|uniref:MinD/ParA family ATP-binding protein n=1 Tax=Planctomonas sp. JC2975 TaxID=2729626 RepID=UPI001476230E|nr:hypothetical protein [Planctomonas sp. JC2975]NNC14059.1 hypothetical protein [Planctomonas sp. JC2975]